MSARNYCTLCNMNAIGDENHYIFECSYFADQRERFLPLKYTSRQPYPNRAKDLFDDEDNLPRLAQFCKIVLQTFKKKREPTLSPLKIRKTHVMASGRVSKRPAHLNDYFV